MKTTKKAARIGADQLIAGIAAASTAAKARIEQLGRADVESVAGGSDIGAGGPGNIGGVVGSILGGGSTTDPVTVGMWPTDNDPADSNPLGF